MNNKHLLKSSLLRSSPFGIVAGPTGSGKSTLLLNSAKEDSPQFCYYNPHASYTEYGYFEMNYEYVEHCFRKTPELFNALSLLFVEAFPLYKGIIFKDGNKFFILDSRGNASSPGIPSEWLMSDGVYNYLKILSLMLKPDYPFYTLFIDNADSYITPLAFGCLCSSLKLMAEKMPVTAFMAVNDVRCIQPTITELNCFIPLLPHLNTLQLSYFPLKEASTYMMTISPLLAKGYQVWFKELSAYKTSFSDEKIWVTLRTANTKFKESDYIP